MINYNKSGTLIVTNEDALFKKINSCKVKHFSKLNYNDFNEVYKYFNETPRYIFSKLQCVYWQYFEEIEIIKFKKEFVNKILKQKEKNNMLNLDKIIQNVTKTL